MHNVPLVQMGNSQLNMSLTASLAAVLSLFCLAADLSSDKRRTALLTGKSGVRSAGDYLRAPEMESSTSCAVITEVLTGCPARRSQVAIRSR